MITDDMRQLRRVMREFDSTIRLAERTDNPFLPPNAAYGLKIKTADRWTAGTDANVTFTLDGTARTLANAANVYGATTPGTPTNAGYTEPLLVNRTFSAGSLTGGSYHAVTITFNNSTTSPASFRFGYSRTQGDIDQAAAMAAGKKAAIVFVNDGVGAVSTTPNPDLAGTTISAPTQPAC